MAVYTCTFSLIDFVVECLKFIVVSFGAFNCELLVRLVGESSRGESGLAARHSITLCCVPSEQ